MYHRNLVYRVRTVTAPSEHAAGGVGSARVTDSYRTLVASFPEALDAIRYADARAADGEHDTYEVRDVENIDVGDILTSEETAYLVRRARATADEGEIITRVGS